MAQTTETTTEKFLLSMTDNRNTNIEQFQTIAQESKELKLTETKDRFLIDKCLS